MVVVHNRTASTVPLVVHVLLGPDKLNNTDTYVLAFGCGCAVVRYAIEFIMMRVYKIWDANH